MPRKTNRSHGMYGSLDQVIKDSYRIHRKLWPSEDRKDQPKNSEPNTSKHH